MGYVPPKSSLSVQIRADMQPILASLYELSTIMDVSNRYLRGPGRHEPDGYTSYVNDLYGNRPADNFMLLNNALLACLLTLVALIVYAVTT